MQLTDPQKFTIVSAIIVAAVVVATGLTTSRFFRNAIIGNELSLTHDLVRAFAREEEAEQELSAGDLKNYTESAAKAHLDDAFRALTRLPGFSQAKVFDPDLTIVWSSEKALIGTKQTRHPDAVTRAIAHDIPTAFNPSVTDGAGRNLIEFYIPFRLGAPDSPVAGVVSLYRLAEPIETSIRNGVVLVWLVTGLGGIVMYAALYRVFLAVHHGRSEVNSRLAQFSAEHARLIQLEKLSAMGQMVAEIAHQLNNPLVGVVNLAELAEREADNPARVKQILGDVRTAGERCRDYVQRILGLSQLSHPEIQAADLGQIARDTVAFFQQSLGAHPAVTVEVAGAAAIARVDPLLMRNALFNLIHNAAQADRTGPVTVSIAREERGDRGGYCVAVSDCGTGIAPEIRDKLFTPFFTTRAGGTGLGLSIAQHIAILHGGTIEATNRPDGGARVSLWIPDAEATT